jgi:hypothetical protein
MNGIDRIVFLGCHFPDESDITKSRPMAGGNTPSNSPGQRHEIDEYFLLLMHWSKTSPPNRLQLNEHEKMLWEADCDFQISSGNLERTTLNPRDPVNPV